MGNLKNLEDHRPDILLAEVAAWLHDAGKLHLGHQAKYLRDKDKSNYYHTKFGPGGSRRFLQNFAGSFPQIQIMREQVSLQEIIRDHHKRDFGNCHVANNVVCLIQRADWLDSEYDRSGIITRGTQAPLVQPTSLGFGVFSVFGLAVHLYKLDKNSETIRKKAASCSYNDKLTALLCSLKIYLAQSNVSSFNQQQRKNFISIIKITLNKAAGDTRYSVNDIALLLCLILLRNMQDSPVGSAPNSSPSVLTAWPILPNPTTSPTCWPAVHCSPRYTIPFKTSWNGSSPWLARSTGTRTGRCPPVRMSSVRHIYVLYKHPSSPWRTTYARPLLNFLRAT